MPPDIVIRPAGIWDSRAPFHNYLKEQKRISRSYALSVLTALKVERDLRSSELPSIRKYFNPRIGVTNRSTPRDTSAWRSYKRALGRVGIGKDFQQPTLDEVLSDLEGVISAVRRSTLLNYVALFESYLQCWVLNYLLSKLEVGQLWTNEERLLATKLSPVHGTEVSPSTAFILRCLPNISQLLRKTPPFFRHPVTRLILERPEPVGVTCLAAIDFWIDLRNTIVHRAGWLTRKFIARHEMLWMELFGSEPHIPQPKYGRSVLLYHEMVTSAALTLYRAALALSNELESISQGRRGHPWAPSGRLENSEKQPPISAPSLLIDDDHENSVRWAREENFRIQFVQSYSR